MSTDPSAFVTIGTVVVTPGCGRSPLSESMQTTSGMMAAAGAGAVVVVAATVAVVDEATGSTTTHAVTARADGADLVVSVGTQRFALADLPADPRTTVVSAWWARLLEAPEPPPVAVVRAVVEAGDAAAVAPDREVVEAALLRVAPAVVHRALDDPAAGLPDLAFVVDALAGALPTRLRWTAQNALLAARDRVLPRMRTRGDEAAAAWCSAFARSAEVLAVAPDPP